MDRYARGGDAAAASGIPATVAGGDFPERSAIIAIAFVVHIGTIGIQATTLPWMIARLHLHSRPER